MKPELKTIVSPCGTIHYAIFGENCVFTGGNSNFSSTTFAAEIVAKILLAETVRPQKFFDFQTHSGFSPVKSGKFDFHQVLFEWRGKHIEAEEWKRTPCPPEVLEVFCIFVEGEKSKAGAKDK